MDGNPQRILDRGEKVTLPPMFILQGELDDNVLPSVQEHFVATYCRAGGEIDFEIFRGCDTVGSSIRAGRPTVPSK